MNLILTHEQADFDALAALLAASLLDETAIPVLPRRINRNTRAFLNLYGVDLPFVDPRDLPAGTVERVTLVDTQSLATLKGMNSRTQVFVVDHHPPRPDLPADWTYSGERIGACTTLLVEVLREHNDALGVPEASLMLLGIYEDTGSLTFASTTARDVRAAAHLLEQGASLRIAANYLNPPLSPEQLQVYDRLIQSVQTYSIQGQTILVAATTARELAEEISSIAHKVRDLLDPDALFLFIQTAEGLRLVARSTSDQVNVAQVALHFGGGGHERAAAALIKTPFPFEVPEDTSPLAAACRELLLILPGIIRPAITVGQIMSRQPLVLDPFTSVHKALGLMQRYGYEGYPVVADGKVIGLLTRRAVDRAVAHKLNLTAANVMEGGEVTITPQDSIDLLQRLMSRTGWGQVPVVDPETGAVVGIVTRTDLLKALAGGEEKLPGRQNLGNRLDSALPPTRLALLKTVAEQAHRIHQATYIVGGVVRDLLLERPSLDFDIVVEGDAIALGRALTQRFGGRIVSHSRFGTAKWWIADQRAQLAACLEADQPLPPDDLPESLDLISARTEYYEYPTALPTVERSNIKLDLHRRDFTINTMAIRLDGRHYGDLYDYWGGLTDLRQHRVRVLHSLSFVDDPTRMLRAVRFEQRFDFQIEARTLQLMAEAYPLVRQVSGERLRHELDLILSEPKALAMLDRLAGLGLLHTIHPDLDWNAAIAARVQAVLAALPAAAWDLPPQLGHLALPKAAAYTAWFASLTGEHAPEIETLLRLPTALIKAVAAVRALTGQLAGLAAARPSAVVEQLETYPSLALYVLQFFTQAEQERDVLRRYALEWHRVEPLTTGDELRARGVPPGPIYRQLLGRLRRAWLEGEIDTAQQELDLLEDLLMFRI